MYSTRLENSEKNSKKIQKIRKPLSTIIFSQNDEIGPERQKKEKKNSPIFSSHSTGQENSEKNSKKIEKITKPLSEIIFSQNGNEIGRKREKKNFNPEFHSYSTQARKFRKKY